MNFKRFISIVFSSVTLSILFTFLCNFSVAQDDRDDPDSPELAHHKGQNVDSNHHLYSASLSRHRSKEDNVTAEENGYMNNATLRIRHRGKRQFGCPNGCYSPCSNSGYCQQRYQLATVCMLGCCCPATTNLSTACDGDAAVAACLNGLCGQGYTCSARNFCCRCKSGTAMGECVDGICPPGYTCNLSNRYCCSIGSGSQFRQCVDGKCPIGYACGAGNLCYPTSKNGN